MWCRECSQKQENHKSIIYRDMQMHIHQTAFEQLILKLVKFGFSYTFSILRTFITLHTVPVFLAPVWVCWGADSLEHSSGCLRVQTRAHPWTVLAGIRPRWVHCQRWRTTRYSRLWAWARCELSYSLLDTLGWCVVQLIVWVARECAVPRVIQWSVVVSRKWIGKIIRRGQLIVGQSRHGSQRSYRWVVVLRSIVFLR